MAGEHPALVHLAPALVGPSNPRLVRPRWRISSSRTTRPRRARKLAKKHYGKAGKLKRDEDVLDTWFSSALWPFSTMGWPDETPELKRYYPTSVLVTGFDIIFFWVARMMMMGMHFMKEVPFRNVYIHALVRDEKGRQDVEVEGQRRRSAVRHRRITARMLFASPWRAMAAQGRDMKLSMQRIEGYRNFATKLWNAARFSEMNGCVRDAELRPSEGENDAQQMDLRETNARNGRRDGGIENYRFNDAATEVYRFVWNKFCDWYLEFAKPVFLGSDEAAKAETQAMAAWALDEILKLLHPFMPFITEELWEVLGEAGPNGKACSAFPQWPKAAKKVDEKAVEEVRWVIDLISEVRSLRSETNVPPASLLPLTVIGAQKETKAAREAYESFIRRMGRVSEINFRRYAACRLCAIRARRGHDGACPWRMSSTWPRSGSGSIRKSASFSKKSIRSTHVSPMSSSWQRRLKRWSRRTASAAPKPRPRPKS